MRDTRQDERTETEPMRDTEFVPPKYFSTRNEIESKAEVLAMQSAECVASNSTGKSGKTSEGIEVMLDSPKSLDASQKKQPKKRKCNGARSGSTQRATVQSTTETVRDN